MSRSCVLSSPRGLTVTMRIRTRRGGKIAFQGLWQPSRISCFRPLLQRMRRCCSSESRSFRPICYAKLCSIYHTAFEQPHLFMEKKSRLQGTVFWGPEVAFRGKGDRNRTSKEINTHHVPHFLFVQAWTRLNEICQNFEDHIEDS